MGRVTDAVGVVLEVGDGVALERSKKSWKVYAFLENTPWPVVISLFLDSETRFPVKCEEIISMAKDPKWTTQEGKTLKLSEMDVGHLCNTIRMLSETLEKYRAEGADKMAAAMEKRIMQMQEELATRDREITQLQGLARALIK